MKLPEHYEKWVESQVLTVEPDRSEASLLFEALNDATYRGARAMFEKLMKDFAPAVEVLKEVHFSTSELAKMNSDNDAAYGGIRDRIKQALAGLKEKGLVE